MTVVIAFLNEQKVFERTYFMFEDAIHDMHDLEDGVYEADRMEVYNDGVLIETFSRRLTNESI
jgi:hypothetical protein